MALGMEVGLGPGHILLDGDPAPLPERRQTPNFRPMSVVAKRLHQDTTWYGGRPQPRRHCVIWVPSSPPIKGHSRPQFSANVRCGQMAGWTMPLDMEVGLGPDNFVLDADPAPPEKRAQPATNFWPMFIVAKRLDRSRCYLVRR